jgi:hypothetical protein
LGAEKDPIRASIGIAFCKLAVFRLRGYAQYNCSFVFASFGFARKIAPPREAERAERVLKPRELKLFHSAHPSGRVRARFPQMWEQIPYDWAKALNS